MDKACYAELVTVIDVLLTSTNEIFFVQTLLELIPADAGEELQAMLRMHMEEEVKAQKEAKARLSYLHERLKKNPNHNEFVMSAVSALITIHKENL